MKHRKQTILALFLLLILTGCNVVGIELRSTIAPDGSGTFEFTQHEIWEIHEDGTQESVENPCTVDDESLFPLGYTTNDRLIGEDYWCTITVPFDDVSWLESFLSEFGEEAVEINCMGFADDTFILDMSLFEGMDASDMSGEGARGDEYLLWEVTIPGPVNSTNAHTVEGNTLTWYWDVGGGDFVPGMPVQVNVPEDGRCPFGNSSLFLLVETDGTGSAQLTMVLPASSVEVRDQLVATLAQSGWQILNITETGQPRVQARREFATEQELDRTITSIPGFTGGRTFFSLEILADDPTGWRQFSFDGRIEFDPYKAYWSEIDPDRSPPGFRFDLSLPGVLESSPGMWSDPNLLVAVWDAETGPAQLSFKASSTLMPPREQADLETVEINLENIETRFVEEIPKGQVVTDPTWFQTEILNTNAKPGHANNLTNGKLFACGDYQGRVLKWLDSIRLSPDPAVRAQLDGLDYGPIEAYRGGHQAVVLFPIGEDWRISGHVLDPWPYQEPRVFTMGEWEEEFSWGIGSLSVPWGIGPGEGSKDYSHLFGNPSAYPASRIVEDRVHPVRIGVHSPVNVLITSGGNRLGMLPDGTLVNEIPGADFYPPHEASGTRQWLFGLPTGDYEVQLTGTDTGDYHIYLGGEDGEVRTYGGQPIHQGEQASFLIDADIIPSQLKTPNGELIDPIVINQENFSSLNLEESQDGSKGDSETDSKPIRNVVLALGTVAILGLCLAVPVVVGIIYLVWRKK